MKLLKEIFFGGHPSKKNDLAIRNQPGGESEGTERRREVSIWISRRSKGIERRREIQMDGHPPAVIAGSFRRVGCNFFLL